ncbi:TIGR03560 family F420-dependent LLM class oxidoreductase [Actinomarinicola tropica]|uniref:TIGR03560 family F420-dependent LLM class oxidoreductase n=1 Tax=Actinomarinicola tropica TaxID=2789776 RepID=A0A5Q2RKI0_9ACTN|nr:TIGR03560 family F420-dependent LLM class oxidoreductase [Actinomarinicola tropica]QGG94916.1 TIGR03560 family F420-dependent LLM class oxidoreductase [Actinomarinicola tropica]
MRFSFWVNNSQGWDEILATSRHAAATGWDGVWVADHFMPNAEDVSGPMHEAWSLVAGLAAAVERVRIGVLVSGNTYRHPAVLAKAAATADHISGGRVVLGLGAGWQENEHERYGIEFSTVGGRLDRLEEACEVVTRLFTEERVTFAGEHYQLTDAPLEPKPVQSPLPLLIGGGGEKRTMRIAARFAQEWNVWGTPDVLRHKNGVLDAHCHDVGRDPGEIRRSCQGLLFLFDNEAKAEEMRQRDIGRAALVGTPEQLVEVVAAYRDAGVDELIVPDFTLPQGAAKREVMDTFIEQVAAPFRDR